jgi:MFS family permease
MRAALTDPPILALTIGQLLVSAALYYLFPAMVLEWRAEFGWSSGQLMGAFSLSLVVQGLVAAFVGRLIDRGFATQAMSFGAVLGATCLALVTQVAEIWQFYAIWCVMGLAMGLTLYESVFALIIRSRDDTARSSITAMTLVAGFASSIAYLVTASVSEAWGWRSAMLLMAGLVLVVNVPLVWFATRRLERDRRRLPSLPALDVAPRNRPGFWPLALGISLSALGIGIVVSHLLPLLASLGVASGTAVLAASLLGPSQVAGRLAMTVAGDGVEGRRLAIWGLSGMAVAAAILLSAGFLPSLVFAFAVLHGMCYGLTSILRPVIIRETLGVRDFGASQGAVMRPAFLAFAAAPFVAAVLADAGGYLPVILLCIAVQTAGAAMLLKLPRS